MTAPAQAAGGGIPVLGPLSPISRIAIVGTVVVAVVAIVLEFVVHADQTLIFIVAAAAILGLAWVVGLSTERLGAISGPQVGGILNATFGNIAELIIAFFALQAGLIDVVKASITGSIIGNLLLVLGASVLARRSEERHPALQPRGRRLERRPPGARRDRAVHPGGVRRDRGEPTEDDLVEESGPRRAAADGGLRRLARLPVHEPVEGRSAATSRPRAMAARPGPGRVAIAVLLGSARCSRSCRRSSSARSSRSSRRSACPSSSWA